MKSIACLLALLLGAWFAASFFGAEHVDIRVPVKRFWALCGYALAASITITTVEELIKRVAPGFRHAWLTAMIALLAIFLLGVSITRLTYLLIQGQVNAIDAVAAGFFLMSFSLAIGIVLPKMAMAALRQRGIKGPPAEKGPEDNKGPAGIKGPE